MSDLPKCYDNEGGVIAMLEGLIMSTCGDTCCVNGFCDPKTKLCISFTDGFFRGGCTDQSWESESCSQICPLSSYSDESEQQGYLITGAQLTECNDGTYCCGPFNDPDDQAEQCCDDGLGFSIDSRGSEVPKPTSTTRSTSSSSKSQSTTQATAETTETADSQTDSTNDIRILSTGSSSTTKATAAESAPTSSSTTPSGFSPGLSTGARIGIGIGSAVAIIAICVALFFFYRERKLRKRDALKRQSSAFLPDQQENYCYETSRVELTGDPMRVELEGNAMRAELPAGEVERKIDREA